jgi:signal peptidase II
VLPIEAELDKRASTTGTSLWLSVVLGLLAFGIDRLHKVLQLDVLGWSGGEWIEVLPVFDYVLVWNSGVSYGLLSSVPAGLLLAIVAAAMLLLSWWWWRTRSTLTRCGLALCLGGALSNAVDRGIYGAVADFFHFHLGGWSFYIFNLADVSISAGVVLLLLDALRPAGER